MTKYVIFIGNIVSYTEDTDKPIPIKVECDQKLKNNSIDFDIILEQLDTHKEVTDEDVMHHLDVIENIELDQETFGIDKSEKNIDEFEVSKNEEEMQHEEVIVLDEVKEEIKENWYKEKVISYSLLYLLLISIT